MSSAATLSPRLKAQLDRVPKVAVEAAAQAMEEGADEIVALMRSMAPRRTGELADSIAWTWGDAPKGALVIDEIRSGARRGEQYATLRLTIYVGAWYAHFPEFGTVKAPAHPFFFPGWRAKRREFRAKIRAAVRLAIKEALND